MTEQHDVASAVAATIAARLRAYGIMNELPNARHVQAALGREVATAAERYEVKGCWEAEADDSAVAILVVVLERTPSVAELLGGLIERYGLTRREAAVARLLAQRRSTAEIAAALGISSHTVRHHTERVLAKLGVRSRADAAAKLAAEALLPNYDSS